MGMTLHAAAVDDTVERVEAVTAFRRWSSSTRSGFICALRWPSRVEELLAERGLDLSYETVLVRRRERKIHRFKSAPSV